MSVKDFSTAWDEAALRALEDSQESELTSNQLVSAAGMCVRSGVIAGAIRPPLSYYCTGRCNPR